MSGAAGDLEPEERERLEELLRAADPERPDPRRREAARQAFLARAGAASRPGALARSEGEMTVEEDAFAAWLARHSVAPVPDGEFRARARRAFLTEVARDLRPARRTQRTFRALVLGLAAAAMIAVTFLLPEPARWRVRLDGSARFVSEESLDSSEFAPGDEERLAVALESSGTLETGAAAARLALGALDVVVHPGAALVLPALPELDGVSSVAFELLHGEAFVRTRGGYPGNPVLIRTPLADVMLHGTTVGVLVDGQGTCVCVAEGTARVTSDRIAGFAQEVGARTTLQVFQDRARPPRTVPFAEEEAAHTDALVGFEREK